MHRTSLPNRFVADEHGAISSVELTLLATVLLIGLMVGVSATRDAIVSELSDVAGSVQDSNQSYSYNGITTASASLAGSNFGDALDIEDDPDDAVGAADNCITFDGPILDELVEVSTEGLVLSFDFSTATDADFSPPSPNGALLDNGATIVDGELQLDGDDDFLAIANSPDINLATITERTIGIQFTPTDVDTLQIVFEEGGNVRGLNVFIDNGELFVGAYNRASGEPQFNTFFSTAITAGQPIAVALTLDAASGELTGFLNGSAFGSGFGGPVFNHPGAIGLGALAGNTVLPSGVLNTGRNENYGLAGSIGSLQIYNRVLSDAEIFAQAQ